MAPILLRGDPIHSGERASFAWITCRSGLSQRTAKSSCVVGGWRLSRNVAANHGGTAAIAQCSRPFVENTPRRACNPQASAFSGLAIEGHRCGALDERPCTEGLHSVRYHNRKHPRGRFRGLVQGEAGTRRYSAFRERIQPIVFRDYSYVRIENAHRWYTLILVKLLEAVNTTASARRVGHSGNQPRCPRVNGGRRPRISTVTRLVTSASAEANDNAKAGRLSRHGPAQVRSSLSQEITSNVARWSLEVTTSSLVK